MTNRVEGTTDHRESTAHVPGRIAATEEDFRSALVHQIVQPLTALSGRVQMAKKFLEADPARAHQALDEAYEHITRIDRLLTELRENTSRDAGRDL
jgi:phosphoglycerate-specific signal transduction histidine kinase